MLLQVYFSFYFFYLLKINTKRVCFHRKNASDAKFLCNFCHFFDHRRKKNASEYCSHINRRSRFIIGRNDTDGKDQISRRRSWRKVQQRFRNSARMLS